jgi:hypothetical protein
MICEKCGKEDTPDKLLHCGGCGTILCEDCLSEVIETQKEHELDYCSYCWKTEGEHNDRKHTAKKTKRI